MVDLASTEAGQPPVPPEIDAKEWEAAARKPCRVSRISLLGLQRTKAGLVERELRRVHHAATLEDIKASQAAPTSRAHC